MQTIDQTETGYEKAETSDGRTVYRDPDGKFTSQQAFAASKGREQNEAVFDSDGNIAGNIPKADEESRQVQFDVFEDETEPPDKSFRSTGVVEDTYVDSGTDWGLEVWVVTEEPSVDRGDIQSYLKRAARLARQRLPFIQYSPGDEKVQMNQPMDRDTHDWKGEIRAKSRSYTVTFGPRDSVAWNGGSDI